jgi:hypothetical protein
MQPDGLLGAYCRGLARGGHRTSVDMRDSLQSCNSLSRAKTKPHSAKLDHTATLK